MASNPTTHSSRTRFAARLSPGALDGKVVAFACDNSLFVKPSQAVANLGLDLPQRPPYPGAKNYPVADELLDDSDAIRRLIVETAALMPAPKPRKPRKAKPGGAR